MIDPLLQMMMLLKLYDCVCSICTPQKGQQFAFIQPRHRPGGMILFLISKCIADRASTALPLCFVPLGRYRWACLRSEQLLIWPWVKGCRFPNRASAMALRVSMKQ